MVCNLTLQSDLQLGSRVRLQRSLQIVACCCCALWPLAVAPVACRARRAFPSVVMWLWGALLNPLPGPHPGCAGRSEFQLWALVVGLAADSDLLLMRSVASGCGLCGLPRLPRLPLVLLGNCLQLWRGISPTQGYGKIRPPSWLRSRRWSVKASPTAAIPWTDPLEKPPIVAPGDAARGFVKAFG